MKKNDNIKNNHLKICNKNKNNNNINQQSNNTEYL